MNAPHALSQLSPAIQLHLWMALAALVIGPLALTVRKGSRLHRGAGYAWLTLMVLTAASSAFIRDFHLPNLAGYTPIHVLSIATLIMLFLAVRHVVQGRVTAHQALMRRVYFGACVGAGLFTLMPGRFLGQLVWGQWLGLL